MRELASVTIVALSSACFRGIVDAHHVDDFIPFGRGRESEMDFERRDDAIDEQ